MSVSDRTAADLLRFYGLELHLFDEWIASFPVKSRAHALAWRHRAVDAVKARNTEAAEAWALFLRTLLVMNRREDKLRAEWAEIAPFLPPPGQSRTVYRPKKPRSAVKARAARVIKLTAEGWSAAAIAEKLGIAPRSVYRIRAANP